MCSLQYRLDKNLCCTKYFYSTHRFVRTPSCAKLFSWSILFDGLKHNLFVVLLHGKMRTEQTHAHSRRRTSPARQSALLPIRSTGARLILYHSNTHDSAQAQSARQNFRYGFDLILACERFFPAPTFFNGLERAKSFAPSEELTSEYVGTGQPTCATNIAYGQKSEMFDTKNAIRI